MGSLLHLTSCINNQQRGWLSHYYDLPLIGGGIKRCLTSVCRVHRA